MLHHLEVSRLLVQNLQKQTESRPLATIVTKVIQEASRNQVLSMEGFMLLHHTTTIENIHDIQIIFLHYYIPFIFNLSFVSPHVLLSSYGYSIVSWNDVFTDTSPSSLLWLGCLVSQVHLLWNLLRTSSPLFVACFSPLLRNSLIPFSFNRQEIISNCDTTG